ncbi:hypothetical protein O6H91_04G006500 [Diphasiastrum complanatum]|uniref:Uncharacterized protein n=1 Tax=Diphasiastrum complanatum TaxID=34168 RepID=A0ACC2DTT3_DIPCM|nr:hypothetical protein O6H91_04G006500 [Diphasiastrum complanatum]
MGSIQTIVLAAVVGWIIGLFYQLWWKPFRLRKHYEKQGIQGPPFRPLIGNLLELRRLTETVPPQASSLTELSKRRVAPELLSFFGSYGKVSVHEVGRKTRLLIVEAELAREVLVTKASFYQKADLSREAFWRLLGKGLVFSEGDFWLKQRRILRPGFRHQYLKVFFRVMNDACEDLVSKWQRKWENSNECVDVEIEVSKEMSLLTLDIISRALFGSNLGGKTHASEGAVALECLSGLLNSSLRSSYSYKRLLPGYSHLPTLENWRTRGREKFVNGLLEAIIHSRMTKRESVRNGEEDDIVGMMLDAVYEGSSTMSLSQLMHEAKTLFFAGHATTAIVLTWCLTLLSMNKEWQERARDEVQRVYGEESFLDVRRLGELKIVGMILNETLRLYPPVPTMSRQCMKPHHIGNISMLPDTTVVIPVVLFHQSEELWGKDAYLFKPERFENKEAKDLPGFMPFGGGPRICLGMNFAVMEAKVALSMLLKNFSFSLSPDYCHAPGLASSMRPRYGVPLIVKRV